MGLQVVGGSPSCRASGIESNFGASLTTCQDWLSYQSPYADTSSAAFREQACRSGETANSGWQYVVASRDADWYLPTSWGRLHDAAPADGGLDLRGSAGPGELFCGR